MNTGAQKRSPKHAISIVMRIPGRALNLSKPLHMLLSCLYAISIIHTQAINKHSSLILMMQLVYHGGLRNSGVELVVIVG